MSCFKGRPASLIEGVEGAPSYTVYISLLSPTRSWSALRKLPYHQDAIDVGNALPSEGCYSLFSVIGCDDGISKTLQMLSQDDAVQLQHIRWSRYKRHTRMW